LTLKQRSHAVSIEHRRRRHRDKPNRTYHNTVS
jgi:hypothetical protein